MPSFTYVARDGASGHENRGSVEASSAEAAVTALLNRNLLVVSIQAKEDKRNNVVPGGKVPMKDLVIFTRQMATMVDAGMSVLSSMRGLAKQTRNKVMRDVINDLCTRIEGGENIATALKRHPKVFTQLYVCMIEAGEQGGLLAEVLARLASYMENTARLRRKVKSALMYPTMVSIVALGITIFLLVKVVPVFGEIFDNFHGKLPAPTEYLIEVSNFVRAWLFPLLGGGAAAVYGLFFWLKTPQGREVWDTYRIRIPTFGSIALNICLSRFTRTFSSLVRSGVPLLEVMNTVSKVCGNVAMEKAITAATVDIQHGMDISDALAKHPLFPDMIVRMMAAGEQTGKIDVMMERIANSLDDEIETVLSGLTALIEPILIVFLGVVVGGIVICMFLPIFKLGTLVGGPH